MTEVWGVAGDPGTPPPALDVRHLSKVFGGEHALNDAHLTVLPGEVHGLLGENGSGKSTLIKILAGYHAPEAGAELSIAGVPVELPLKPGQFRQLRMSFVHQHLGLIPSLSVIENLRIIKLASMRGTRIHWRRERQEARDLFRRFNVTLDLGTPVAELSQVDRALLAIVRAVGEIEDTTSLDDGLAHHQGILILDEPTVFLSEVGLQQLFQLIREVAARGLSVIFVSHDLDEVRQITDRITVLRDGHVVGTVRTAETSEEEIVAMIIGRQLQRLGVHEHTLTTDVAVSVSHLSGGQTPIDDISFDIRKGEILGVTGLVGSGFDEFPYLLYGAIPDARGQMTLGNTTFDLGTVTPDKAVRAGLALIPANRQRDGSIGSLTIRDNVMMQVLDRYFSRGWLHRRAMNRDARAELAAFDVRPNRPELTYQSLSGGNQQKVLLAKWLQTEPSVLLLHEPTQGVDIGARLQIFRVIRAIAQRGTCVICASSDYEQLESICDRVIILDRGKATKQLTGTDLTKERITEQCLSSMTGAQL